MRAGRPVYCPVGCSSLRRTLVGTVLSWSHRELASTVKDDNRTKRAIRAQACEKRISASHNKLNLLGAYVASTSPCVAHAPGIPAQPAPLHHAKQRHLNPRLLDSPILVIPKLRPPSAVEIRGRCRSYLYSVSPGRCGSRLLACCRSRVADRHSHSLSPSHQAPDSIRPVRVAQSFIVASLLISY